MACGGGLVVLEVAGEHGRRAREDLAVVGDPQLDALERPADRADPHVVERHQRADRGVLGLAVDLVDRDARAPRSTRAPAGRSGRRRRPPRSARPRPSLSRSARSASRSARRSARSPAPSLPRIRFEPPPQRCASGTRLSREASAILISTVASIFSHTRGTPRNSGRLDVAQVLGERLAALAEVDDVAGAEAVDDRAEPLGDVAQRQVGEHLVVGPVPERPRKLSAAQVRLACVSIAPLGGPVVPEV